MRSYLATVRWCCFSTMAVPCILADTMVPTMTEPRTGREPLNGLSWSPGAGSRDGAFTSMPMSRLGMGYALLLGCGGTGYLPGGRFPGPLHLGGNDSPRCDPNRFGHLERFDQAPGGGPTP